MTRFPKVTLPSATAEASGVIILISETRLNEHQEFMPPKVEFHQR